MNPLIEVKDIQCRYRNQTVVDELSLHVNKGSFACLLGPSGCGKTTVLRAIAGLEQIYRGEISVAGNVMSRPGYSRAPEKRGLGMVFQDYALFPHMTITDNIRFGLRAYSAADQRKNVLSMLSLVGMTGYENRYPHELSGGQMQRIALARALAPNPEVILLDEPFSNLDVDLRERISQEVGDILQKSGATTIMVTHHQDEAFALGDQIGVMDKGQILQWDTAFNLYHEPANRFIADFIGQGVFLKGTMQAPDSIETALGILKGDRAYTWSNGTQVELLLRPDDVTPDADSALLGKVTQKAFKGAEIMYTLDLPNGVTLLSLFPSHSNHAIGEKVGIKLDLQHVVAFAVDE